MLDPAIWAWLSGGAGREDALNAAIRTFDDHQIYNRILANVKDGHTRLRLFERVYRHPIFLAPLGYQSLLHRDGECALAQGADAMDACMTLSTLSSKSIEEVAGASDGPKWFQLYFQSSREHTIRLIRRAEAAGYLAIVATVDTPVQALTPRAHRAGFKPPDDLRAANLDGFPPAPPTEIDSDDSLIFQAAMRDAPGWSDLEWLTASTPLPVLVKGVCHPDDASRCLDLGAAGVVLSSHGGRALDAAPAPLAQLPIIRETLGEDAVILLDSGVRSGSDAFKALALGANAVMVGRLQGCALGVAGALGVAHMLKMMREELELTMALAGRAALADITPDALIEKKG